MRAALRVSRASATLAADRDTSSGLDILAVGLAAAGNGNRQVSLAHGSERFMTMARLAELPEDYGILGISDTAIEPWEDGFRTSPGVQGTVEWWYFDTRLDDGSSLVIVFYTLGIREACLPSQPLLPRVTLQWDRADGRTLKRKYTCRQFPSTEFNASADRCDVRIGPNGAQGDLDRYDIHFEQDQLVADVTMRRTAPSWRPHTGHWLFGPDGDKYFAWLVSVPRGIVEANITVSGHRHSASGSGYHDHSWGNAPLRELIHRWFWARAHTEECVFVAYTITSAKEYGHLPLQVFLATIGGQTIDGGSLVQCRSAITPEVPPSPPTYRYDYADTALRVDICNGPVIAHRQLADKLSGSQQELARLTRLNGEYWRISTTARLSMAKSGNTPLTLTAPCIWEAIYFDR